MFTKYASVLALAATALAAPLAEPEACKAGSPLVTVTTYITGYPPSSTSSELAPIPSPTPGAFYEAVPPKPETYDVPSSVKTPEGNKHTPPPAYVPEPPKTLTTSTSSTTSAPPPPPPPPATYAPAPVPPKSTTKASNPEPTYGSNPPPPPPSKGGSGSRSMTPHDKWSSSVGVVGCKINTNRVAYWPEYPDVTRYCVKLTYKGRSLHLLHIDQSGGANDISYDAWNYLATGKSATEAPHCGGGIDMEYEWVDNHACDDLIYDEGGRLPLLAGNPDLAIAAPEPKDKYVTLWNFKDLRCETGVDEQCKLPDYAAGYNQAECPSGLGMSVAKTGLGVEDCPYITTPGCPAAS